MIKYNINHKAEIEMFTCEYFNVPLSVFRERSRRAEKVMVRHVLWTLLRDFAGMTYVDISSAYGVDHTTVMHGVRKVREWGPVKSYYEVVSDRYGRSLMAVDKPVDSVLASVGNSVEKSIYQTTV